jgi:hypothetical protein
MGRAWGPGLSHPLPNLPHKGEGVCRCVWRDRDAASISTSPPVGEIGRGVVTHPDLS